MVHNVCGRDYLYISFVHIIIICTYHYLSLSDLSFVYVCVTGTINAAWSICSTCLIQNIPVKVMRYYKSQKRALKLLMHIRYKTHKAQ